MKTKLAFTLVLTAGGLIGYLAANSDFGGFSSAEAKNDDVVSARTSEKLKVTPPISGKPQGKLLFARNQHEVAALSAAAQQRTGKKPNIVMIWGDDVGRDNLSIFTKGMMGYHTPNIDRLAKEGMLFTDFYADQSCTAGRSS